LGLAAPDGAGAVELRGAVVLGEATPDAVWLAHHQGVRGALAPDRARQAQPAGGLVALTAGRLALSRGMEEQLVVATATGHLLPVPAPGLGAGGYSCSEDVGHGPLLSTTLIFYDTV
jgi:hypothetical protein